ncbi:hypothetical protein [Paenibacillus chitinolyticus]
MSQENCAFFDARQVEELVDGTFHHPVYVQEGDSDKIAEDFRKV